MTRALSAALLSAFVFPGAGHLYLHRKRRGMLFLLPALAAATVFVVDVMGRASAVVDKVMAGTVAPDLAAIAAQLEAGGSTYGSAAATVLVLAWAGSIADAFVVARSVERAAR
jgi:hypothetical protein